MSPHIVAEESTSAVKVDIAPDNQQSVASGSNSNNNASPNKLTSGGVGSTDSNGFYFVQPKEGERNFYQIGLGTGTDKVTAPGGLPGCLKNDVSCTRPGCVRPECRPWGHHYDTIYQQRLGPYSRDDTDPFQFLEIGFFNGAGYDTYREFLPKWLSLYSFGFPGLSLEASLLWRTYNPSRKLMHSEHSFCRN